MNSCAPARIRSISAASGAAAGRGSRVSTGSTASSAERALSTSRRSVNCVVQHLRSSSSPLRPHELGGERGRVGDALADQRGRQPHPEQAEPVQQPRPRVGGPAPRPARTNRSTDSSIAVQLVARQRGQRGERGVLGLPQGPPGLRQQPGHGDDVLAQPADRRVGPVAAGDAPRREHRVEPPAADLVGPRQHRDGVDRRRPGHPLVVERLEERARRGRAGGASGRRRRRPGSACRRRGRGTRRRAPRLSLDSDAMPGVSINVVVRRLCAGQSPPAARHSSADAGRGRSSARRRRRRTGSGRGAPSRGCSTTSAWCRRGTR